jgi:phage tail sheath protein FI
MPVTPTYPGVYIEEIPSGVRTITGVATSIAAFAGWAPKGPTDAAGLILSWEDYYRQYGGLDARSLLGYAVSQFFANGGQQGYIVRLAAADAAAATQTLDGRLKLDARSPGAWANDYGIAIKVRADDATRFRLQVVYVKPGSNLEVTVESFENLSMSPADSRSVEHVINEESTVIKATVVAGAAAPPGDTTPPTPAAPTPSPKFNGGADGTVLAPSLPGVAAGPFEVALTAGVTQLDHVDLFNLLCVPGEIDSATLSTLQGYCREHRAFLIADCSPTATVTSLQGGPAGLTGDNAINAAFYFPWINAPDSLSENRPRPFPPSGFVAGLYARTDATRGVWKAPAGTDASLTGVSGVVVLLNDRENGVLNPHAVNCIRNFNVYGTVIWGARTLRGNDEIGSEWKYIPVRRTALFLEESLYRALKWVVFEPNDEPLWAQIRLNVGAFMHDLFRQGAFQGKTPQDAYFVKCDKETTTQSDINRGIVNIVVGFAPLKPAEFVIIKIQQMAGQIDT